ncbi:MAG TPA: family 16 glycoside hydrolase [Anaerolineales bacterium]|nr:family 16 glycoside hydrolase [Anaerolineales bacterium]
MKNFRPLILFAVFVLVIGLACVITTNDGDTPSQPQPTTPPQVVEPTVAPPPTEPPTLEPTVAAPTEPPAPEVQQFYTEEFDTPLSGYWDILTVTGSTDADPDKVTVEAENGNLVWDFESKYVYYYLFYNAYTYEDVELTVRADNRGRNNNSVSLICRYDPEVGWYEFNIANNGLYDILYGEVKSNGDISYSTITNGGSNDIKQGKEINEYSISCDGDKLSLTINGREVNSITEKNFGLREGQVGVSVSSFDVLPILVEMDWIKISEP